MSWIKLVLHPHDPKVAIVAQEVGATRAEAYFAMLLWLFWLDANYTGSALTISPAMFKAATGWPNDKLAKAFQSEDVDWVTEDSVGRITPTRPDSHFSDSAKQRALASRRQSRSRRNRSVTPVTPERDWSVTRGEEKRGEEREETVAAAGGVGDEVQEKGAATSHGMTPAQQAIYATLLARPLWLPQEREWIEATTARGLALRDTSTPAHVAYWLVRARDRRREAREVNLAGFVIGKLERPDMALVEALSAQEQST